MRLGLYEFQRSSFNWRVRRLVQSGLLERHSKLPWAAERSVNHRSLIGSLLNLQYLL